MSRDIGSRFYVLETWFRMLVVAGFVVPRVLHLIAGRVLVMDVAIPKAGEDIGGYRLVRPLGKGGAGIVWEVKDGEGARFALKLLHPAIAADPASRVRLAREAAVLNRIRTDGVANVVDLETEAAQPFVVTELVDGLDLREEIRAGGPFSFADALEIARSLQQTLSAVHAAGVIHRDLKPSNIILGATQPVLIDFGIAQADEDERLTSTGLVSGTVGWVAPEVMRGREPDEGSDWWAWAAILLNMLTGRAPYGAGSQDVVLSRQMAGQLDLAGLYPPLAQILESALGERADRPSPAEVLQRLDDLDPDVVQSWTGEDGGGIEQTALLNAPATDEDSQREPTAISPTNVEPGESSEETSLLSAPPQDHTSVLPTDDEAGVAQTALYPVAASETTVVPEPRQPGGVPAPYQPGYPVALPSEQYAYPPAPQPHQGYPLAPGYPNAGWDAVQYSYSAPSNAFVFSLCVASFLAALPVSLGIVGGVLAVGVLLIMETVGRSRVWREKRRVRAGEKRSGDNWLATLNGGLQWIPAAGALAFNLAFAVLIAGAAWALYSVNNGLPPLENPYMTMLMGVPSEPDPVLGALLWGSNMFAILLARVGAGGNFLREGSYATAGAIPRVGRVILSVLAVVAVFLLVGAAL
ncbi:MAG: protein kinase [Actinomyces sp.]|uniref:serine/threonine-protein kinase n=1 Tax=uncultured Actinomyces sp. TaxID=249061 RepID=UPI00280603F3|nr:protein kinase [uncultured Actinomyces sp.]MDU4830927.1 protein kinase [Actinomyces sp.]